MKSKSIVKNDVYYYKFINTVYIIQELLGFNISSDDIRDKSEKEEFMLYFNNKQTKRWRLGIWAVGKGWGIETTYKDYNGEIYTYENGYGFEDYPNTSICIFLIHEWDLDKFRPTNSHYEWVISKDASPQEVINVALNIRDILNNPIDSFYNIRDRFCSSPKSKNKYVQYLKDYIGNEFKPNIRYMRCRTFEYICTRIVTSIAKMDRRVFHVEYRFTKLNGYNIAIVLKRTKSDYKDWQSYNFYKRVDNIVDKYNVYIAISYTNKNNQLPKNIYRGVYWTEIPSKD